MRNVLWVGVGALLCACAEDAGDKGEADAGPAVVVDQGPGLVDVAVPDGAAPPDAAAPDEDAGPDTDAGPTDAGVIPDEGAVDPDMGPVLAVNDCPSACARYGACERLAEIFGDEDSCLSTCERASFRGPPEDWFACVEVESCNLLQLCRPPRPSALTCDEICEFGGDCGADVGPDCAAACEAGGDAFLACGETLFECDPEAFTTCLVRDVYTQCGTNCTAGVECNLVRRDECVDECLQARLSGDPLAVIRVRERGQCISLAANDCFATNECFTPPDVGGESTAIACGRYCSARDVCDVFEPGEDRPSCTAECNAAGMGADPDALERLGNRIDCGSEFTCRELVECLDRGSPRTQCEQTCAGLGACGLADEDCVVACDAVWPRDRQAAYRACVAAAGEDCDAVAACQVAPQVPCDDYCARLGECGALAGDAATCANACDDRHFATPVPVALEVACALAAPVCADAEFSVAACLANPEVGGRECANYCRAVTECAEEPAEQLGQCLTRCVAGLGNREGLVLDAARECLAAAAIDAECGVIRACLPAEPPAVDCEAFCDRVGFCQVPGDCAVDCAAAPDPDQAGCVVDALRAGSACTGVAACVGYEPEPPSEPCAALCDTRVDCDRALDSFLCRLACTPAPPELAIQRACADASLCPELGACLELGPEVNAECADVCADAVACGVFADDAACLATCTGQAASPRAAEDYLGRVAACLELAGAGAMCAADAAERCFNTAFCELEADLVLAPVNGGQVRVNTVGAGDDYSGSCDRAGEEVVVLVTVQRRANVRLEIVEADYDTLIWLRGTCDDANTEIDCDDDGGNGLNSRIDAVLDPGTYFLFVDGFADRAGSATVEIAIAPL